MLLREPELEKALACAEAAGGAAGFSSQRTGPQVSAFRLVPDATSVADLAEFVVVDAQSVGDSLGTATVSAYSWDRTRLRRTSRPVSIEATRLRRELEQGCLAEPRAATAERPLSDR